MVAGAGGLLPPSSATLPAGTVVPAVKCARVWAWAWVWVWVWVWVRKCVFACVASAVVCDGIVGTGRAHHTRANVMDTHAHTTHPTNELERVRMCKPNHCTRVNTITGQSLLVRDACRWCCQRARDEAELDIYVVVAACCPVGVLCHSTLYKLEAA